MPDPNLLVVSLLRQGAALVALLGGDDESIVAGELPAEADPIKDHPWVTVNAGGGRPHPEAPIPMDRVMVKSWAPERNHLLARQIDEAIVAQLHQKNGIDLSPDGVILISQQVVRGQSLTDPDNGAACVLSYYEVTSRDS